MCFNMDFLASVRQLNLDRIRPERAHTKPDAHEGIAMTDDKDLFDEDGDDLTCRITDGGSFMPIPEEPEALPERGRGLAFMSALADRVDISHFDDGTIVCLTFSR